MEGRGDVTAQYCHLLPGLSQCSKQFASQIKINFLLDLYVITNIYLMYIRDGTIGIQTGKNK